MFELSIQTKTYLVFGIMIGCFIILYPKIFHPMVLHIFGLNPPSQEMDDGLMHPRERAMRMGQRDTYHPHSRPHPGMRAERQTPKDSSRGGGIMSMILPVYAICIVLYLVYTLAKVFGNNNSTTDTSKVIKTKSRGRKDPLMREHYNNFDYCPGQEGFTMHQEEDAESEGEESGSRKETVEQWLRKPGSYSDGRKSARSRPSKSRSSYTSEALRMKTLPSDLERLLKKVDDKNISEREMRELRVRLEETERQMTQLLEAMRTAENESANNGSPQDPDFENTDSFKSEEAISKPLNKNSDTNAVNDMSAKSDTVVERDDPDDDDMDPVTASEGEEINDDVSNANKSPPISSSVKTAHIDCDESEDEIIENCGGEIRERKLNH